MFVKLEIFKFMLMNLEINKIVNVYENSNIEGLEIWKKVYFMYF